MSKIMLVTNEDTGHYLHRLPLARALQVEGHEVILVSPFTKYADLLLKEGFRCINWNLSRKSLSPLSELKAIWDLARIYRTEKPDIVQHFTIKPILYGPIAARLSNRPKFISTFTGVSFPFTDTRLSKQFRPFISLALGRFLKNKNTHTIFHNPDDQKRLIELNLTDQKSSSVILGGGVNTAKFQPVRAKKSKPLVVLMASRLIQEKGIHEYAEAAKILQAKGIKAEFWHIGGEDEGSLVPISPEEKVAYEDAINFKGHIDDMPGILGQADIVVLPSYHEGLPRFLLESASAGLPIVTTNVGGCKYVAKDGVNGFLVPVKDINLLASSIETLINDSALREKMGQESRRIAIEEFEESFITDQYVKIFEKLLI